MHYAPSKKAQLQQRRYFFAKQKLAELAQRCNIPTHNQIIIQGKVKHMLPQLAIDLDADLIVMGQHERDELTRLLLGSTFDAIIHAAPCEVQAWLLDAA